VINRVCAICQLVSPSAASSATLARGQSLETSEHGSSSLGLGSKQLGLGPAGERLGTNAVRGVDTLAKHFARAWK
jgi:hypothetical protein